MRRYRSAIPCDIHPALRSQSIGRAQAAALKSRRARSGSRVRNPSEASVSRKQRGLVSLIFLVYTIVSVRD